MKKPNYKKLFVELKKDYGVEIPKENEAHALAYLEKRYEPLYKDYQSGAVKLDTDITPKDYALTTIANGINDGEYMENIEVIDLGNGLQLQKEKDQEIIEVDQEEVKKALRLLLTKENDFLARLYQKWEEFNQEYFFGELSYPLITIDKLDNRTLGNYTHGRDNLGISNHIRLNRNFVALNTEERILETLKHEMIHQWQDEVLYAKPGESPRKIRYKMVVDGVVTEMEAMQKKRPKDWHNKDFKEMAKVVGIPAEGDKCYENPVKMPEPKSYNRKFICGCVASNGYPLTVWSTRFVNAICQTCGKPFREVPKVGKVIQVSQSHIEKPGEDAVEKEYSQKYRFFKKFTSKELKDEFLENFSETEEYTMTNMAEGIYQKHHNAYKDGFTHWVAYNTNEPIEELSSEPEESQVDNEPEKVDNTEDKLKAKRGRKPKEKTEEPAEPSKEKKTVKKPIVVKTAKVEQSKRDYKNPKDLLDLYKELGSIKAVADYFGKVPGTIIYQAKQLGVDFKKGVTVGE